MRNVSGCLWFNMYFFLAYLQIWAFMQFNSLNIQHNKHNNVLYSEKLRNTRNMQKYAPLTYNIVIRDAQNMYKNVFA